MDPELKEIPTNEEAKKKKKKNKNKKKKKKNKNKENVETPLISTVKPEQQTQLPTQSLNGKTTTKAPPVNLNFKEDALPTVNINKPTIPLDTKIPNFNEEPILDSNAEKEKTEENDSEDEGIEDYKLGGYHPVHIGEVIIERYVVIQKLGWGHFSTVWLCKDFKYDTYVAMKIMKSSPHYLEAAFDEVEILQRAAKNTSNPEWLKSLKEYYKEEGRTKFTKDDCHVVQLLNSFIYQGPYGNHFCMVFEIMGVNLLEIIKRYNYRGVPMHLCRRMAKQILIGLDYLHRICGVIHTDLKPENILVCLTKEETKEIVENGQLSRTMQYEERIKEYQSKHGIKVKNLKKKDEKGKLAQKKDLAQRITQQAKEAKEAEENKQEGDEGQEEKKGGKGKNRRKKEYKKRKKQRDRKQKEENEKLMEYGIDPETLDEETREKILEEILEEEKENEENNEEEEEEETETKTQPAQKASETQSKDDKAAGAEGLRGPKLSENFRIKIVDLGNACWTHHHFTTKIQTRQYRSPEVILGLHYGPSADIWSFACTIFEMLTGDFLFEPRKGQNFGKNDDHFAQVIELLRLFPKKYVQAGKNFKKFFDKTGNLKRIQGFHYWPLRNVLTDKYRLKEHEAEALESFILPMLDYYPLKRASAQECLRHPWLKMPASQDYTMNEEEINRLMEKRQQSQDNNEELEHPSYVETEDNDADDDFEESDFEERDETNDTWYSDEHDHYGYKHVLNKSYDNGGYKGYAGGIEVAELDQEANWQFKSHL